MSNRERKERGEIRKRRERSEGTEKKREKREERREKIGEWASACHVDVTCEHLTVILILFDHFNGLSYGIS